MPTCDAPGATVVKNTRSPGSSCAPHLVSARDIARSPSAARDAVLAEHVAHESAAIESRRIAAAVPVGRCREGTAPCPPRRNPGPARRWRLNPGLPVRGTEAAGRAAGETGPGSPPSWRTARRRLRRPLRQARRASREHGSSAAKIIGLTAGQTPAHLTLGSHRQNDSGFMEQTLLLNATYEPLKVVHWQKAITLWCQGKVEVISTYEREVRSRLVQFQAPSVIRLLRYIKIKRQIDYVPFSRANIYARDEHTCQYCAEALPERGVDLRSCGAGRPGRPKRLGEHRYLLHPLQPPQGRADSRAGRHASHPRAASVPTRRPAIRITIGLRNAPESWRDYFYWNVELDDEKLTAPRGPRSVGPPAVGDRGRTHHARRRRTSRSIPSRRRCASARSRRGSPRRRRPR